VIDQTPKVVISKKQRNVKVGCRSYMFVVGNGVTDCDNCALRVFKQCHLIPCTSLTRINKKDGFYRELSSTTRRQL
jgi:hypothetical protein